MFFKSALKLKELVPSCNDNSGILKGEIFGNFISGIPLDNPARIFGLLVAFNRHLFNPGSFL